MVTETVYRVIIAALLFGGFGISAFCRHRAALSKEREKREKELLEQSGGGQ